MDQQTEPEIDPGKHGCPVCPVRFISVGDKKRHIKASHKSKKAKR